MAAAATAIPQLRFEPEPHTYHLGDVELPSVTTVLKAAGLIDYSMIPAAALEAAAARGTAVHRTLEFFDREELDEGSVPPELAGYLAAYKKFLAESGYVVGHIEHRMWHPLYRYAGTLDRTGLIGEDLVILDFKSGMVLPGHALQLAAYANCLPEPRRFRRVALQLERDGSYRAIEYPKRDFQRDAEVFLSALACFRWGMHDGKQQRGKLWRRR
jgi:hypothetical protein